ncbi:hypothetical protein I551_6194 [Mycobacterium ulcerans str. Harvey]|uniref:Uncharacterized protein n=1 Tax=Mycobacterium ulcerans str. Harvey TaxID=1299332 RepID=A0ABP3A7E1_MYCUL|nr:hypothetical protein I551_6194 [Mycobacterium ulcerans str. Harvey]
MQIGVGAPGGAGGHADREADRQFDHDGRGAPKVDVDVALTASLAAVTAMPVNMPPAGPNCSAAEMVALLA